MSSLVNFIEVFPDHLPQKFNNLAIGYFDITNNSLYLYGIDHKAFIVKFVFVYKVNIRICSDKAGYGYSHITKGLPVDMVMTEEGRNYSTIPISR